MSRPAKKTRESRPDILQGTLDLLILRTLVVGPMHGWGISQRIQQVSGDEILVNQGSLYPSLHRLQRRGWIRSAWGLSQNNRKARFYRLTAIGRRELKRETENWERLSSAIHRVLQHA